MRLIDLEQTIFVPVVDEDHGGATYEMEMTVGAFFERFCKGFKPAAVEAIPAAWIIRYMYGAPGRVRAEIIREMLDAWTEEQEGRK